MNKILLIKLGSLGDVLLTTPLITVLKKNEPLIEIDYLTSCPQVLQNNPFTNKIIKIDPILTSKNLFLEIFKIIKLFIMLFKFRKKYSSVFIFHRSGLLNIILRLIFGNIIYSYSLSPFLNIFLKKHVLFDLKQHRILRSFELIKLEFSNLRWKEKDLKLIFEPQNKEDFLNIKDFYVVIAPGGGNNLWSQMETRKWPIENYAELTGRIIVELKTTVVMLGDKNDLQYAKQIASAVNSERFISLTGKTSINQSALILKRAKLFIGNDSFPLFLASAVDIPTIGLFGPTNAELINPFLDKHIAVQSTLDCSPCYNPVDGVKGCAYVCEQGKCMMAISVDSVFGKVKDIFSVIKEDS